MSSKTGAKSSESSNDKALATTGPPSSPAHRAGSSNMNATEFGQSTMATNVNSEISTGVPLTKTMTISPYMDFRPDTTTGDDDYLRETREKALESYEQLRQTLDSSGGMAAQIAQANKEKSKHPTDSTVDLPDVPKGTEGSSASGGASVVTGGYRGASDNLRKMLKSHGITVSSVDEMLSPSEQPSQGEAYQRAHNIFTSTPANLAEIDKRLKGEEVVTKEYLDDILDRMNSDIRNLENENKALKSEKWLSKHAQELLESDGPRVTTGAAPVASNTPSNRGRASTRQQGYNRQQQQQPSSNVFRPMRSQSPASASVMERQRRSQSAEGMLSGQQHNLRTRPPIGTGALNVSHMSDQEIIRHSMDRGLLDAVDGKTVKRLQSEISSVKAMYEAKMTRYEDHIEYLKQQMQFNANATQSSPPGTQTHSVTKRHDGDQGFVQDAGLCIKCAKREAVISTTHGGIYMQKIDHLAKEVASLTEKNESLKERCSSMQQREFDSYNQVKHSVQLVEQAQLERTQAVLECQQMKEELNRCQRKLQDSYTDAKQRANQERESVRNEVRREIDTLNAKIADLIDQEASLRVAAEKSEKDKQEMKKQLEKAKRDVEDSYFNVNKVSDSLKSELAAAIVERDDAKQDLENTKRQFRQESRENQQEMNLLRSEIDELRRRLNVAESNEKDSKEQLLNLTEYVGKLEKEAYQSKRSREQAEIQFKDQLQKAKDTEDSLKQSMAQQKNKFDIVSKDMDDLMCSQNVLIGKLKTECKFLLDQLQTLSFKYQSDVESLEVANGELVTSLKKRHKQVKHFEKEAVKHGRLHQRMKTQLNKMASASQYAQNEVAHLAVKHNTLIRERDAMAQELSLFKHENIGGLLNPADIQRHLDHTTALKEASDVLNYPELFGFQHSDVQNKDFDINVEELMGETERQIAANVFNPEEKAQT